MPPSPRPVQSFFLARSGNGLRRHLLPAAVRDHHEGSRRVGALRLPAQAVLGLRLQRDGPVQQPELMGRKVHIVPSEALDLLPGQPLPPGQAEDQPRRRLRLLRQSWAMARASGRLMVTLLTFRLLPVRGSDERRVTTV